MSHGASIDYDACAASYPKQRKADPRIASFIEAALGDAKTVVNVGAGAGSYEPAGRHMIAIEPSHGMRAQRQPHLAPAIDARAERLPLDDKSVDAAMAIIAIHDFYRHDPTRSCVPPSQYGNACLKAWSSERSTR